MKKSFNVNFKCYFFLKDYIWRLVLCSSDDIATKAIELLKETFTNLGPRLQASQVRSRSHP